MRSINLRFTYLLTYFPTYSPCPEHLENVFAPKPVPREKGYQS